MEKKNKKNQITGNELVTKPVLKPTAQTNRMCIVGNHSDAEWSWLEDRCKALRRLNPELEYIIRLQYESGLRISEVLRIELTDIARDLSIRISASKKGENRIVSGSCIADYLRNCKRNNCKPFGTFNRFFIYRAFRMCGVFFYSSTSKKASVTHAPRHIKVQSLREANFPEAEVSTVIGHKNQNNTKLYGKEKQKK